MLRRTQTDGWLMAASIRRDSWGALMRYAPSRASERDGYHGIGQSGKWRFFRLIRSMCCTRDPTMRAIPATHYVTPPWRGGTRTRK
jgi:hypothetical protein